MNWGVEDFVAAFALLFGAAMLYVVVARRVRRPWHRALVAIVILVVLATLWAELAVGLFD